VVAFDDEHKKVRLSLCQADVLKALERDEELAKENQGGNNREDRYRIAAMDAIIAED